VLELKPKGLKIGKKPSSNPHLKNLKINFAMSKPGPKASLF